MASKNDTLIQAQVVSAPSARGRRRARHLVAGIVLTTGLMLLVDARDTIASSDEFPSVVVLPGATSAEGVAIGRGTTFYAGDFLTGDIYRGDLRSGKVERFIHPPAGRMAVGLKADVRHGLLFVAGGFTGQAYVYDLETGKDLATFQLGALINDVVVTHDAAWFTDSVLPHLYRIPVSPGASVRTVVVSGPAADLSGFPNLNGIAATPNGQTLIVAHSALGAIFAVDPTTGASRRIAGVTLPTVDGILWEGGNLYAALVSFNQIAQIKLSPDLSFATMDAVVTSPHFQVPTTVAGFGDRLVAVNAKYDTGFPPTAATYEVVTVRKP
jgi:outer membrane protein assembly factor BamB